MKLISNLCQQLRFDGAGNRYSHNDNDDDDLDAIIDHQEHNSSQEERKFRQDDEQMSKKSQTRSPINLNNLKLRCWTSMLMILCTSLLFIIQSDPTLASRLRYSELDANMQLQLYHKSRKLTDHRLD